MNLPRPAVRAALGVCVGLLLTSCIGDGASGSSSTTLRIVGPTDTRSAAEAVLAAFEKAEPDIKVEATFTSTDHYLTTTRAQLAGSTGADVLLAFSGGGNSMSALTLGEEDALVDLSDERWASRIPQYDLKEVSRDSKVFSFPTGFDTIGAIYDKKFWAEQDVEVPATWTALLGVCDRFNELGITPISLGLASGFVPQFISYALVPSTVYAGTPDFDARQRDRTATFSASGWQQAFEKYLELSRRGCFGKDFTRTTYPQMLAQVAGGKAAMAITPAPSFPDIRAAAPRGDFAMFPLPAYDDPGKTYVPTGLSVGWAINAKTEKLTAAKKFVEFANQQVNLNLFASELGVISIDPEGSRPRGLESMVAIAQQGMTGPFPDHMWPSAHVQETHNRVVRELLTGEVDVASALKRMDDAYEGGN